MVQLTHSLDLAIVNAFNRPKGRSNLPQMFLLSFLVLFAALFLGGRLVYSLSDRRKASGEDFDFVFAR